MAKAIIRKRRDAFRKKNREPGLQERIKKLTADAPVGRIRGGRFVLEKDDVLYDPDKYEDR
jgi:hypothetical protein